MSDTPATGANSGGVASRFVSSKSLEEAKERRAAEWKAAYERLGQEAPPPPEDDNYDPRSLFERLQENKVRTHSVCPALELQWSASVLCRAQRQDDTTRAPRRLELKPARSGDAQNKKQEQFDEQMKFSGFGCFSLALPLSQLTSA